MDVLMDDIVAGKSGGTTVLCAGPPGVGKTLTAEVYSEIIRRRCTVCIPGSSASTSRRWKRRSRKC
jgi:MoxR-like ATPase